MGRLRRVVMPIAIAGAFCACSLVSGWSDLQGGRTLRAPDAATGSDSSTSGGDAGADGPVSKPDSGLIDIVCGSAHCPSGQGCCLDAVNGTGAKQCTTPETCETQENEFLACTRASSCPATAPVCCYDFGGDGSLCLAGCGVGQYELCDTADRKPCSGTKQCTQKLPGTTDIPVCQ